MLGPGHLAMWAPQSKAGLRSPSQGLRQRTDLRSWETGWDWFDFNDRDWPSWGVWGKQTRQGGKELLQWVNTGLSFLFSTGYSFGRLVGTYQAAEALPGGGGASSALDAFQPPLQDWTPPSWNSWAAEKELVLTEFYHSLVWTKWENTRTQRDKTKNNFLKT